MPQKSGTIIADYAADHGGSSEQTERRMSFGLLISLGIASRAAVSISYTPSYNNLVIFGRKMRCAAHALLKHSQAGNLLCPQKWKHTMAAQDIAALEAQVNALDRETAERVTRLVFECSASLDLALLAVQDANSSTQAFQAQQARQGRGTTRLRFALFRSS